MANRSPSAKTIVLLIFLAFISGLGGFGLYKFINWYKASRTIKVTNVTKSANPPSNIPQQTSSYTKIVNVPATAKRKVRFADEIHGTSYQNNSDDLVDTSNLAVLEYFSSKNLKHTLLEFMQ